MKGVKFQVVCSETEYEDFHTVIQHSSRYVYKLGILLRGMLSQ